MKHTKYKTISGREANELGLVPITTGYCEPEYEMLDKAIATLGDILYSLVETSEGIVVARPDHEVNLIKV